MNVFTVTEAVISKGFNGEPALHYTEGENPSVRFRIGERVYDSRVEGNYRWINYNVRAFDYMLERIKRMKLDSGSWISISGQYDEDVWEDENTHETKRSPVIRLNAINYCYTGNGNGNGNGNSASAATGNATQNQPQPAPTAPPPTQAQPVAAAPQNSQQSGLFDGFKPFGAGANPFFSEG